MCNEIGCVYVYVLYEAKEKEIKTRKTIHRQTITVSIQPNIPPPIPS